MHIRVRLEPGFSPVKLFSRPLDTGESSRFLATLRSAMHCRHAVPGRSPLTATAPPNRCDSHTIPMGRFCPVRTTPLYQTAPTCQSARTEMAIRTVHANCMQLRWSLQPPGRRIMSLPLLPSHGLLSLGTWLPLVLSSWEFRCSHPWRTIIFIQSLLKPTLNKHKFRRQAGLQQVSQGTYRAATDITQEAWLWLGCASKKCLTSSLPE